LKDKFLFWISKDLLHFGVANSLQKNNEADLYAIIESFDKPKKFFQNQKFVNFRKTWYLDNLGTSKHKPDIEYLKSKENEYGINLWSIAYGERYFSDFNKYYTFTYDDILSFFEQEFRFFEKILDEIKPNFVIMRVPDFHHIKLFYDICRKKGIKILIMNRTKFSLKNWYLSQKPNVIDIPEKHSKNLIKTISDIHKMQTKLNSKSQIKKYSNQRVGFFTILQKNSLHSIFELFISRGTTNERERFLNLGRTRSKMLFYTISILLKFKFRDFFINKNLKKSIPTNTKFVYFPLHVEPERALLMDAPYFVNQINVIQNIAKSLPVDHFLVVKEHPIMKKLMWRPTSFYKQLMNLPNVILIHPNITNEELIKNCSIVTTITGTAGLQAAFFNKPSIIFGDVFYSNLSSVIKVNSLEELPLLIKKSIETKINENDVIALVNNILDNSFEFDNLQLDDNFNPFHGTMLSNVSITDEQMKKFLEKNKKIFDELGHEHIKKITQLKEKI
jgi:hypothetical protein